MYGFIYKEALRNLQKGKLQPQTISNISPYDILRISSFVMLMYCVLVTLVRFLYIANFELSGRFYVFFFSARVIFKLFFYS